MSSDDEKLTVAQPVPSFENPFKPQLQHHVVETKPFSFDSQTREMFQRRQQRVKDAIEEEEKVPVVALCNARQFSVSIERKITDYNI